MQTSNEANKKKILIVGDEEIISKSYADELRDKGFLFLPQKMIKKA